MVTRPKPPPSCYFVGGQRLSPAEFREHARAMAWLFREHAAYRWHWRDDALPDDYCFMTPDQIIARAQWTPTVVGHPYKHWRLPRQRVTKEQVLAGVRNIDLARRWSWP